MIKIQAGSDNKNLDGIKGDDQSRRIIKSYSFASGCTTSLSERVIPILEAAIIFDCPIIIYFETTNRIRVYKQAFFFGVRLYRGRYIQVYPGT